MAQVGSRLLFRGYGVGRRSLSLEAGLAACDSTICLDEAHLAEPFRQTVAAICARRADTEQALELPGLGLTILTATPGQHDPDAIMLEHDDREQPELKRRLHAEKWARLEEAPATERERIKLIAETAIAYVDDGAPTVACILNTVKRAREVFDLLSHKLTEAAADVTLLVGPQRPHDRRVLLSKHGDLLFGRTTSERPLICVATQAFEVGLDVDVAAMITDSASAAALVQRLGRLNRGGRRTGRVTIVRDEGSWLYEADEPLAWRWLRSRERTDETVDVSVAALDADRSRPLPAGVRSAPTLTPGDLDLLVQTNPQPGPWQEPSVEGFLRGAEDQTATDVAVCWRCDLLPYLADPAAEGYREMLLSLVPPQEMELLTLSVKAARALVAARYPADGRSARAVTAAIDDADVEGESPSTRLPEPNSPAVAVPFLVIRRDEVLHGVFSGAADGEVEAASLRPGDVLVLPTEAGGVDRHGLAPAAGADPATGDVAGDRSPPLDVSGNGKDAPLPVPIRISPGVLGIERDTREGAARWATIARHCRERTDAGSANQPTAATELVQDLLGIVPDHPSLPFVTADALSRRAEPIRLLLRSIGPVEDDAPTLDASELAALTDDEHDSSRGDEAEDPGTNSEVPIPGVLQRTWVLVPVPDRQRERQRRSGDNPPPSLEAHEISVREQVEAYTAKSSLPDGVKEALALAARGHDHGKADPRIQAFFHGGVRPLGVRPIAKSVFGTDDPRTERLASSTAGLPGGLRHEISSVAALSEWLASTAEASNDVDRDLVLHLVASHHGQGRPIPRTPSGGDAAVPFYVDAAGISETALGDGQDGWADGEWLERFWRVTDRYGEWGTAYIEALLVLADRTVSARGD